MENLEKLKEIRFLNRRIWLVLSIVKVKLDKE